jgi:hypothetical protein
MKFFKKKYLHSALRLKVAFLGKHVESSFQFCDKLATESDKSSLKHDTNLDVTCKRGKA